MLAGLPPQPHQGLHVPDNEEERSATGSCPGAENGIPAVPDVWRRQSGGHRVRFRGKAPYI